MNILMIEPDIILARLQKSFLEKKGFSVDWTASAQEAITLADAKRPDVVLLEMLLPRHNGIEFLYEFRSYDDWNNIPIIVNSHVSKKSFGLDDTLWSRLGIKHYLYKPLTSLDMLHTKLAALA